MMQRKKVWIAGGVAALGIAGVATGIAAGGLEDSEEPITGEALVQASAAALAYTDSTFGPGGRVTETEVGDEESYYEVEVTLSDGRQVDVQLDEDFKVVGSEADGAGEDD